MEEKRVTRDELIERLNGAKYGVAIIEKDGRRGAVVLEEDAVVWENEDEEPVPQEFTLVQII